MKRRLNRFTNGSLKFNGTSTEINVPGTWGGASWTSATFMCWIFVDGSTADLQSFMGGNNAFVNMQCQSPEGIGQSVVYTDSASILLDTASFSQLLRGWHHLAISTTSGSTKLYLDGVLLASDATAFANLGSTSDFNIGRNGVLASRWTNGSMSEVAVYKNTALTQAQIQAIIETGNYTSVATPELLYLLNEGVGSSVTDSGSSGSTGTVANGSWVFNSVSSVRPLVKPRGTGSVAFNGTTQYGVTPTVTFGINQITVAMWVKPQSISGNLMESSVDYNVGDAFLISNSINKFGGSVHGIGVGYNANTSAQGGNHQDWHRVVLVWDGTLTTLESKIYVDGRLAQVNSLDSNITVPLADNPIYFGSRAGTSSFYRGFIGASLIHASKLWTAAEVLEDYLNDVQPSATVLAKWDFTDGSGATVTDSSGNGYHITLTGSPVWSTDVPMKARTAVT